MMMMMMMMMMMTMTMTTMMMDDDDGGDDDDCKCGATSGLDGTCLVPFHGIFPRYMPELSRNWISTLISHSIPSCWS